MPYLCHVVAVFKFSVTGFGPSRIVSGEVQIGGHSVGILGVACDEGFAYAGFEHPVGAWPDAVDFQGIESPAVMDFFQFVQEILVWNQAFFGIRAGIVGVTQFFGQFFQFLVCGHVEVQGVHGKHQVVECFSQSLVIYIWCSGCLLCQAECLVEPFFVGCRVFDLVFIISFFQILGFGDGLG